MGVVPSGFLITGQNNTYLRPASEGWLNNLALLTGDQAGPSNIDTAVFYTKPPVIYYRGEFARMVWYVWLLACTCLIYFVCRHQNFEKERCICEQD